MGFMKHYKDRARRKLKALPEAVKAELRVQSEANAKDLANLMKDLVPVDEMTLHDSIRAEPVKRPSGLAWSVRAGDDEAYYARFVEFGTKAVGAREATRNRNYRRSVVMTRAYAAHHATRAQPFFWPAYRLMKKQIRTRMNRAGRRGIRKVTDQ